MFERLKKLLLLIDNYPEFRRITYKNYEDLNSWQILRPLLDNRSFVPFTKYSLTPYSINLILNDIILHNRKSVVEFGSGALTILLCRLIRMNKLDLKFISIDSNSKWIEGIRSHLETEDLVQYVELIYAPLAPNGWYDKGIVEKNLEGRFIDCMIVDGPITNNGTERYEALPLLRDHLYKKSFALFLDDAHRDGEKNILKQWSRLLNIQAKIYGKRIGVISLESPFFISPAWHGEDIIVEVPE